MSGRQRPQLLVVDVCGTLVRDDTTLGLLRHHFSRMRDRRTRVLALRALTARRSPLRVLVAVLEKFTGRHLLKRLLVGMLAGDREAEIDVSAREYAQALLENRRVTAVWERLGLPHGAERIVLASASLEPVVKALAEALGTRYVASSLEAHDGVLTGRYQADLTGKKEEAIARKYGPDVLEMPFGAFSDNLTDRDLMAKACSACVVLHRESHRERWNGMAAEYVRIDE